MPKLPIVTPRKLLAALLRQGFFIERQRGSHAVVRHTDGRFAVIPMHGRDVPKGTLKGILDDLDLTARTLRDLL